MTSVRQTASTDWQSIAGTFRWCERVVTSASVGGRGGRTRPIAWVEASPGSRLGPWVVSKDGRVSRSTSAVGVEGRDTRLRLPVSLLDVGVRQRHGTSDLYVHLFALERVGDSTCV